MSDVYMAPEYAMEGRFSEKSGMEMVHKLHGSLPVRTQVISSGLLWGVGDIIAQSITHSNSKKQLQSIQITHHEADEFKINWKRVAITGMFGLAFIGPFGHFCILYNRGVYPEESFGKVKKYGLPLLLSRDEGVKTFFANLNAQLSGKFCSLIHKFDTLVSYKNDEWDEQ